MTKHKKRNRRKTKYRSKSKSSVSPLLIVIMVGAAFLVVGGLVWLGNQSKTGGSLTTATVDINSFPTRGDANAPVTMIEYSDFGCPHCRRFILETEPLLAKDYIETGKVKYIVHPFHLGRPEIAFATEASLCANDQNKFTEYQRILFENQGVTLNQRVLNDMAAKVGIGDENLFSDCLSSRTYRDIVENGRQAARRQGIKSTPSFFINGTLVEGNVSYDKFKSIIDKELVKALPPQ